MRDPKRINKILEKIKKVWEANPDWRLGQLLDNVMSIDNVSGSGIPMHLSENEIFNFEDDKLMRVLEKALKKWCNGKETV